ncbi:hypothetical protein PFISCL1PPCAC_26956, partial [Pristionchus fissidentatus]
NRDPRIGGTKGPYSDFHPSSILSQLPADPLVMSFILLALSLLFVFMVLIFLKVCLLGSDEEYDDWSV